MSQFCRIFYVQEIKMHRSSPNTTEYNIIKTYWVFEKKIVKYFQTQKAHKLS